MAIKYPLPSLRFTGTQYLISSEIIFFAILCQLRVTEQPPLSSMSPPNHCQPAARVCVLQQNNPRKLPNFL